MKNHMKAESIEQIREHLARGGRVLARNDDRNEEWEAIEFFDGYLVLDVNGMRFYCPVDRVKPEGWELVPIEEEKKVESRSFGVSNLSVDEERRDITRWRPNITHESEFTIPIEAHDRLRKKVLFGQTWTQEEQLEVCEMLTGERIQHGRRCNYCECAGRINYTTVHEVDCPKCNGSGYTVRPTWMEQGT